MNPLFKVIVFGLLVTLLPKVAVAKGGLSRLSPTLSVHGARGGDPVATITEADDNLVSLKGGAGVALLLGLQTQPIFRAQKFNLAAEIQLGYKIWSISGDSSGSLRWNRWPLEALLLLSYRPLPLFLSFGISTHLFSSISSHFDQSPRSFRLSPPLGLPIYLHYVIRPWLRGGLRVEFLSLASSVDDVQRDGSNYGLNLQFLF